MPHSKSSMATWFGGYTGGWAGYIPTADAYPQGGYEVNTSPFAPEAADRLVSETLAALRDLGGDMSRTNATGSTQ